MFVLHKFTTLKKNSVQVFTSTEQNKAVGFFS